MKDEISIQEYMGVFNSIISKLVTLDMRIEDEEKASFLFYFMLKFWDNLIINLSHFEIFKIESIVASFANREDEVKFNQGSSSGKAMVARGRPFERERGDREKSKSKSKEKKKVKYWNYEKSWHIKKDCWFKGVDTKSESTNFQGI